MANHDLQVVKASGWAMIRDLSVVLRHGSLSALTPGRAPIR